MLSKEIVNKIESVYSNRFLGNSLIFSDDDKSQIYDEVATIFRRVVSNSANRIRKEEYTTIAYALIELTKEWDNDEDAWREFIFKRLLGSQSDNNIRSRIYNQICSCLDSLNREGKFFMLDCFTKKYYTSVCSHAFAPKSSVFSFFDMCWEIYCKDLFQQYAPNDPVLKLIVSSLKNKFSNYKSDEFNISIGSKVYSLRAGIKGLAIARSNLMIELLDTSLLCMHSLINNEPIVSDSYFKQLLKEWWNSKELSFGLKKSRSVKKYEYVATDYSQIKSKFILEDGIAKLVVPPFRLIDDFDCEPDIEIKVNGKTMISDSISTMGSGIIMTTKAVEYELDSFPLRGNDEIIVEIKHASKTIYNSRNSLKREFILFGSNKELNSQNLLPGTYFIYTPKINEIVHPNDIQRITKNLYSFVSKEGDIVQSIDRIVFFETEKTNKDIYFTSNNMQDVFYRKNGVIYKIIDGDLYVDVNKDYDITDLGVKYADGAFRLPEFEYSEVNGRKRFKISILADAGEPVNITVFKYSNNHILDAINIIKFNNISVTFDKNLYYGNVSTGTIFFKTERYNLEKKFDIGNEENTIEFEKGEIVFTPPILRWRFDENEWNIRPQKPFYYKKISNSSILEISMPLQMECIVELTNGKPVEKYNNKRLYKIGQTIHSIYKSFSDEVTIFVKTGCDIFEVARVFLKQKFVSDPVYIKSDEYKIEWNPETFIGEEGDNLKLQILDYKNSILDECHLSMKSKETINVGFLDEDYYNLRIIMEERGFLVKKSELFNRKYLFGNIKSMRFKNKIIMINKAVVFDQQFPKLIRPIYVSDIKYLDSKFGSDFYSGQLYIFNKEREKKYINYMKISSTEQRIKINPIRIELKTLSSCYLGYGLDVNDPDFEYDNDFVLTNDGKTTIGTKSVGLICVDFYLFQEYDERR